MAVTVARGPQSGQVRRGNFKAHGAGIGSRIDLSFGDKAAKIVPHWLLEAEQVMAFLSQVLRTDRT